MNEVNLNQSSDPMADIAKSEKYEIATKPTIF